MNHQVNAQTTVLTTQSQKHVSTHHDIRPTKSAPSSSEKQTIAWESPTIDAVDLCMEVTAYF